MTFQSYMKPAAEKHNASKWMQAPPAKWKIQEAFRQQCEKDGLTTQESFERASAFPVKPGTKAKILYCPKF